MTERGHLAEERDVVQKVTGSGPNVTEQDSVDDTAEPGGVAPDDREYARALGGRLRAVRSQQRLSLHGVERKSDGKWKAVVVGSYERGDRAVSVSRLAELAEFYGVPISELLPTEEGAPASRIDPSAKIVLDLQRMQGVPAEDAAPLIRYAQSIQRQRGDYGNKVLSIRGEDLRALALMFDTSLEQLTEKLVTWGVLAPGSIGHGTD